MKRGRRQPPAFRQKVESAKLENANKMIKSATYLFITKSNKQRDDIEHQGWHPIHVKNTIISRIMYAATLTRVKTLVTVAA